MKKVTATVSMLSTLSILALGTAGLTATTTTASAAPARSVHAGMTSTQWCSDRNDHLSLTVRPRGSHWYNLHLSFSTTPARAQRHWSVALLRVRPNNSIFFDFNVTDFAFTPVGGRRDYPNDQIVRNLAGTDHFVARASDPAHHQSCTAWLDVRP